jgi:hypothetical protein
MGANTHIEIEKDRGRDTKENHACDEEILIHTRRRQLLEYYQKMICGTTPGIKAGTAATASSVR